MKRSIFDSGFSGKNLDQGSRRSEHVCKCGS